MNFKILKLEDKKEWEHALSLVQTYDFYHTASYHQLDKSGEARLLTFQDGNDIMALPLIFRKIDNTSYFDVTSVYGYAGWIRSKDAYFDNVAQILQDYFEKEKVVSAFSRIHPIIEGADAFPVGVVEESNITLGIDLTLDSTEQLREYSRSVRRSINKSRKSGINVKMSSSREGVEVFTTIYQEAMFRLKAPAHLFFTPEYFEYLLRSKEFEAFILLAELSGTAIGGAMFISCNEFMAYHLSTAVEKYKAYSPLKLIIDEARKIGNEKKLSVLHLGGGYGGHNDNLYIFKQRMSSLDYVFKVWKWIVNDSVYQEMSYGKKSTFFFPLYRS
ncbi:MAG: GNAT family N-acetyltransferase [Candidatus Azobacteroides sp.]|nr:GNAT family N-acetyltransferase [Candidatus Azobacteroides sp.]